MSFFMESAICEKILQNKILMVTDNDSNLMIDAVMKNVK